MTKLDPFTLATVPLELYFNDTSLDSQATGFMWKVGPQYYLVTNWHVLSARDFFTGKYMRSDAGRPNVLRTLFNLQVGSFEKQRWDIIIRDGDDKPLWLVHPDKRVDIAVLPLPFAENHLTIAIYPFNEVATAPLRIEVGMEVFILGYPFKIAPPAYPIWKRGSIASEPALARLTTNYILVDTASRPGMSGSPVIRRSNWTSDLIQPGVVAHSDAPMNRFIGVYSGRLPTDHPNEAQIGLVWDGSLIQEIIAGNTLDAP
ncbi:serine protease [Rhizobium sp. CB3090]|uniref:S1 family peptidase n=1 Tax=Rhizobium sp. CB3090 TaxID=3039156 RepID=UPI0024B0631B|nr:serine protease [Rhizobium sp. CB3090]WFU08086.1 serine protease [Rhizobium sp. CB3090]